MNSNFLSLINIATLTLSSLFILFGVITFKRNHESWGKKIFISLSLGLLICLLAAIRDGYGFADNSIIPFIRGLSSIFSLLGMTIVIASLSSIFIKKISYRKSVFILINGIFIFKLILMEVIRLTVLL